MKNSTQILIDSRERQKLLDQLAQTVEYFKSTTNGEHFTYAIKASINGEVVDAINNFRTAIEAQLMARCGKSYTNTTYTAFDFIVKVPSPQFNSIKGIQEYYTNKIALLIKEMTLENVDANFVNDGFGQGTNDANTHKPVGNPSNTIVAKGATWTNGVSTIITDLGIINAALMGEVPNIS